MRQLVDTIIIITIIIMNFTAVRAFEGWHKISGNYVNKTADRLSPFKEQLIPRTKMNLVALRTRTFKVKWMNVVCVKMDLKVIP